MVGGVAPFERRYTVLIFRWFEFPMACFSREPGGTPTRGSVMRQTNAAYARPSETAAQISSPPTTDLRIEHVAR